MTETKTRTRKVQTEEVSGDEMKLPPERYMVFKDPTVDIALLKQTVAYHEEMLNKMSNNFDTLSNISSNVSRMLAVGEEKLETQKKSLDDLYKAFVRHTEDDHERFQDVLNQMKDNNKSFVEALEKHSDELKESVASEGKRITKLENLKWVVFGVMVVVLFLTNSNTASILSSIGL